jgi:hypothetical protein
MLRISELTQAHNLDREMRAGNPTKYHAPREPYQEKRDEPFAGPFQRSIDSGGHVRYDLVEKRQRK